MKKIIPLGLIFALLMTFLITGCSATGSASLGTAGKGGVYDSLGSAIERLCNEEGTVNVKAKTTAGSASNIRLLSGGYIGLAFAQADVVYENYSYDKSISTDYHRYSAVANLYTESVHVIVSADSDIKSIEDLKGKKISIGEGESGTEINAVQVLSSYGINGKNSKLQNLTYSEASDKLKNGDIDAVFTTIGLHSTVIDKLSEKHKVRLLSIDSQHSDKLVRSYGYYDEVVIPAGTYDNQNEDVKTLGVKTLLLASDDLSDDMVCSLTELLYTKQNELQSMVSVDLDISTEGITIPFHTGAAQYYEKQGETVNTD